MRLLISLAKIQHRLQASGPGQHAAQRCSKSKPAGTAALVALARIRLLDRADTAALCWLLLLATIVVAGLTNGVFKRERLPSASLPRWVSGFR